MVAPRRARHWAPSRCCCLPWPQHATPAVSSVVARADVLALTLAVGAATWHGWPSALLMLASMLSTVAMFYLRARLLRLAMLAVSLLWMVNAWQVDSWEQIAANLLTAAAALAGAWRSGATADPRPRTATARPGAAA